MKYVSIIIFSLLLTSCKSSFEKVRQSNDPESYLKAANEYFEAEDYLKAQTLYELAVEFYRGKAEAEDLYYRYAYTYYYMKQYTLAAYYFNNFTRTFYNSTKKEEMAFMAAYSNYEMSPSYKLDQGPSEKAIEQLQTFINTYPSSPRVEESNKLIDEMRKKLEIKAFEQGKLYEKIGNYQSAMVAYENVLKDFPETQNQEEIRYLIIKSNYQLAKKSIYEKMEDRLNSTIEKCNKFETKYPKSKYLGEVVDHKKYCINELKRFVQ
jgi:outer membrane protein assembly factor BamD